MRFSFYQADGHYCNFLREKDKCVPYAMDAKSTRPFVGILIEIKNYKYYAPLTSPKEKHLKMKNQIDFIKINEGAWGAINLNNMIPIHENSLKIIDMQLSELDTKSERDYKNLLANQLSWCNSHQDEIKEKAMKLYNVITRDSPRNDLVGRCCNFILDEQQCELYCKTHNFALNQEKLSIQEKLQEARERETKPNEINTTNEFEKI